MLEFEETSNQAAKIKVVGVGGGGGNALNNMIVSGLQGVEFIAANTDAQALQFNRAPAKIQIGSEVTRGLGCGADPDKGRSSALEVRERIREALEGTDMVFVTAGLGGGTGTGAAPVVAEVAREVGALTVGVVTKPFLFEGRVRLKHAEKGLDELHQVVDTVITIPNQRLLALAGKNTAMQDAFKLADEVLFNAVRGISDLITIHGLINLDFADVRTIMNEMGVALMGTGTAQGEDRAVEAARSAISSPLLEDLSIDGAHGVLINITGGADLTLYEVNEASTLIQEAAHEEANIIFGAVIDEDMPEGDMRVTVIATGLDGARMRRGKDAVLEQPPLVRPDNVTPLRPEPAAPEGQPAAQQQEFTDFSSSVSVETEQAQEDANFMSPFAEDELEVPTFIRRGGQAEEDEDEPAFLRRSAD
ncbi:MAG: cell division protein FtsZ [Myxococcota bacterium]|nr:cell division protein FtsZ [Myxococcota bacterium]